MDQKENDVYIYVFGTKKYGVIDTLVFSSLSKLKRFLLNSKRHSTLKKSMIEMLSEVKNLEISSNDINGNYIEIKHQFINNTDEGSISIEE